MKPNHRIKEMSFYEPHSLAKIVEKSQENQESEQNLPIKKKMVVSEAASKQSNESQVFCDWGWFRKWQLQALIFLLAFGVIMIVWAINYYGPKVQSSYFYFNSKRVSPYTTSQYWFSSARPIGASVENYPKSNQIFTQESLKEARSIALYLLYSWLLWKLPLCVYSLSVIKIQKSKTSRQSKTIKYVTFGSFLLILILVDVLAEIFNPSNYQQWIFICIYIVLSLVLFAVNSQKFRKKFKNQLSIFLIAISYLVICYFFIAYCSPIIYQDIYNANASNASQVFIFIFVFFDLLFYLLIVVITYILRRYKLAGQNSPHVIFLSMFYFLTTGYAVGTILLYSPEQVQFYFILVYLGLRNFIINWILKKTQKYVQIPTLLPGWLLIYIISLLTNYIPIINVGSLVVSKSFYSQILTLTLPLVRYIKPEKYYAYSPGKKIPQINSSLSSNTQISAIFIVWAVLSLTQKYKITKNNYVYLLFFYIFGIYLFYFGLVGGTQLEYLKDHKF